MSDRIYTIREVAEICKVSVRTAHRWFDSGRLKGYRIQGSHDRRILGNDLKKFLENHGIPLDGLDECDNSTKD